MKTLGKTMAMLALAAVLLVSAAVPCLAVGEGSITVTLEDKDKQPVDGLAVHLTQIAERNATGYYPTPAFEDSGISIAGILNTPDEGVAATVAGYAKAHRVPAQTAVSREGKAVFTELPQGIFLVYGEEEGTHTFNPYIVFLPYVSGGKLYSDVFSAPKVEDNRRDEMTVYVLKKWDDRNNAAKKRPTAITVELLDGDTVVATAQMDEATGWAHTFDRLPKVGEYAVREKPVPHYKAQYSGDAANGFVITNTYAGEKLPQTGQYWWPIILIGVAGGCFILLGIYELGVKKHGKKG